MRGGGVYVDDGSGRTQHHVSSHVELNVSWNVENCQNKYLDRFFLLLKLKCKVQNRDHEHIFVSIMQEYLKRNLNEVKIVVFCLFCIWCA